MKIGFVTRELPPSKRLGGIGVVVWDIACFLAQQGHKVTIICASDNITQESDSYIEGVRVIRLKGADFFLGNQRRTYTALYSHIRRLTHFRSYRKRVADCLDDLISLGEIEIVEFVEYGNEAEIWSRRRRSIPLVIRLHGPTVFNRNTGGKISYHKSPLQAIFGRIELATIKRADAISSVSKAVGDYVARHVSGLNERIVPIHNGIWSKNWELAEGNDDLCNTENILRVFSAGSVVPHKGYGELVEAVGMLRRNGLNIELVIAGTLGGLGRKLLAFSANGEEYRGWLKVLGPIPRNQLLSYYAGADLVVFPSWWEAFGMVYVEAMAAKALVLASSAGGGAEIITEGKDGFLVAPRNSALLAEKMANLLSLPAQDKCRIKLAACEKVANYFDINIIAARQLSFYRDVLASFSSRYGSVVF